MNKYTELSGRLNRRPPSTTLDGDPQQAIAQIYYAVGATCTAFEKLSTAVVSSFGRICTGSQNEDTGRLISIIGGVSSFNVKTEMITQAANVYIHDDRLRAATDKWVKLVGKASNRRNDIAHGMAMLFQDNNAPMKAVLVPPYLDPRKGVFMGRGDKQMLFRWDGAQILDYCDAIERVSGNFIAFVEQLLGQSDEPEDAWMLDPDQLIS